MAEAIKAFGDLNWFAQCVLGLICLIPVVPILGWMMIHGEKDE